MANIDLKQAATKGYVEGDEYLTKGSSGGLNWTPAHEAPYELLENDISSGTSTKGLVSGEQLAGLIPQVYELTQANIDDKDDVSGTVNPSKVSFGGGGGGGPEVLKDWTTINGSANLFEGTNLDVESYNGVAIEFKDVTGKNASTTANGIVSLRFRRAGNGNPNSGFGSKSNTRSFTCGAAGFDNANSFAFMGVPAVAMTLVGASGGCRTSRKSSN